MAHSLFLLTGNNAFILRAIALHLKVHSEHRIGIAKVRTTRASQQELDEYFVRRITYQELLKQKADRNVAWIGMQDGYTDAILHSTLRHFLKRKHLILIAPIECSVALESKQYPTQIIQVSEAGTSPASLPASWHPTTPTPSPTFHFQWIENNRPLLMEHLSGLMQALCNFPITITANEHGVVR